MTDKLEVVFAPGCFDDFEGTQEELDELIASIKNAIKNGTLLDESEEVDIDTLPADIQEKLGVAFDFFNTDTDTRKLH